MENYSIDEIKKKASNLSKLYHRTLFNEVLPFWEKFSVDFENGGYFTCLDENGEVYDQDKFVWLQAREIWMFSKLVNSVPDEVINEFIPDGGGVEKVRQKWYNIALQGVKFLNKYAFDEENNVYFSLTKTGEALIQPYNIFSDCFTCMAFIQFSKAAKTIQKEEEEEEEEDGNEEFIKSIKLKGLECFRNIERRKSNPKGKYLKNYPGTRNESSLAVPMIDMNICLEILDALENESEELMFSKSEIFSRIEEDLDFIFNNFIDEEKWLVHETFPFSDTFSGRLINPGHTIECIWFILQTISTLTSSTTTDDDCKKKKLDEYISKCEKILLSTLKFGWDEKFGGIFYFMDIQGKPPLQLEWDQKLWWVHNETLISCLMFFLYKMNNNNNNENLFVFWNWFEKVNEYMWKNFHDDEKKGEFWGYLNRRGEVLIRCKGGKWKGCFHQPRSLWMCGNLLKKISEM